MADQMIDLRTLATDWSDEIDDGEVTRDYASLCEELGIDTTPDALEKYGDDYEPTMIREDYFTEYAQELADEICPFPSSSSEYAALNSWPYRHIDWEAAARELKYDYTTVSFDGDDYLIRSC